jgi:hypothetical protein
VLLCRSYYRQSGALASLPAYSNPDRFPHPDPYSDCQHHAIANAFLDADSDSANAYPDCHQHAYGDPYRDGHGHSDRYFHTNTLAERNEHAAPHGHPYARNAKPYACHANQHAAANGDRHPAANQYLRSRQRYPDGDTNNDAGSECYTWNAGTGKATVNLHLL